MPQTIVELLKKAAQANNNDRFRRGNIIFLPPEGSLVIAGDIHGHRRNYEKIVAFAKLDSNPDRHLILQEIIHGGPEDSQGGCLSYRLLFDVAHYKLDFPDQVHIIMSNHTTSFVSDSEVMKNGKEMNRAIRCAIEREFKNDSSEIISAMKQFMFSMPLAIKCENRIWASHSLPGDRFTDKFDKGIFERQLKPEDLQRTGSAYLLTWGRNFNQQLLDKMAKLLDADIFILGHQPQEKGFIQAGKNLIIIASDHNHGCILPINLAKSYTIDELIDCITPVASIS